MKTTTISFWGGFHNVEPIKLRFRNTPEFNADLKEVLSEHSDLGMGDVIWRHTSYRQERTIDNHFCGISDCLCGSYYRNLHFDIISNVNLDADDMTETYHQVKAKRHDNLYQMSDDLRNRLTKETQKSYKSPFWANAIDLENGDIVIVRRHYSVYKWFGGFDARYLAKPTDEDTFLKWQLADYDRLLDYLDGVGEFSFFIKKDWYLLREYPDTHIYDIEQETETYSAKYPSSWGERYLTENEKKRVRLMIESERSMAVKRAKAYYKRYGLSKIIINSKVC